MTNLLLIPGLNCTGVLFAPQITDLGRNVRCHVADHASADTLPAIASAILAAAPSRFALAGLSMGGYVAFEILRQAPQRVERLCLLDTRAAMDTPEEAERRRRTIALATGGQFAKLHEILWPRLVHPARAADRALEDAVLGMMRDTGPERFVLQQTAVLNRSDYSATLAAIHMPVQIIVGAQDEITPPSASRDLQAAIAGARLAEVPDCGHLSTLEQPEAVSALIRAWLAA